VILLDTHVVVWLALTPERLSSAATEAVRQAELAGETPAISAVTLYEVADAMRRGQIQPILPRSVFLDRLRSRFRVIPISEVIAVHAAELAEPFQADPMDRVIAATAIVERCTLITANPSMLAANACAVLW
jgi:PIN domain nuclease of toxin-antitoxin system